LNAPQANKDHRQLKNVDDERFWLNSAIMKSNRRWMPFLVAALTALAMVALRGWDPAYLQAQRAGGFDTLQRIWPRQMVEPQPVRVVDIDEKSLAAMGQWPWPRSRLAELTRNLGDLGAAVVAFDIIFPEEDRLSPRHLAENPVYSSYFKDATTLPDTDEDFAAALSSTPTVLAFATGSDRDAKTLPLKSSFAQTGQSVASAAPLISKVAGNIKPLEAAATGLGNINLDLAGEQGVARSIPMLRSDGERLFPALSIEALRVAQGADALVVHGNADDAGIIEGLTVGAAEVPVTERGLFMLHFRENDPSLYVSVADVLNPATRESLREKIADHIVLVGTSAVGLLDSRATPLGETVPGVSIHAQALEQIMSGQFLTRPEWIAGAEILGALGLATVIAAAASFARPATALLTGILTSFGVFATTAFAFARGIVVDASFPLFLLAGCLLTSVAWRLLVTDRQGRVMRGVFGHYVAPSVLAEIERNPENLKLGGEVRDVTVLFLDIENFTPLSEKLKPDELVSIVNGLWDACSRSILAENGTIDKFIGDAIMAFWNAPLPCEAHQARACKAALAIREAVHVYNHEQEVRHKLESVGAWPLGIRVGIATGPACVGNMGSTDRFDYSVIGETVNTAARAEAACKHVGHDIVVAGDVSAESSILAILPAGLVSLKGRSKRQPITAIVGDEAMARSEAFQLLRRDIPILMQSKAKANGAKEVLKELGLHHPAAARFLETLQDRFGDYQS
jgi:adenylate cyclase